MLMLGMFVLSWLVMLLLGAPMIAWLKQLKGMKWSPREDTPDSHLQKAGTPSMGGIGIVGSATFVFIILFIISVIRVRIDDTVELGKWTALLLLPITVALHAVLGFIDDWSKAKGKGGLTSKAKLFGQIFLSFLFLLALIWTVNHGGDGELPLETVVRNGVLWGIVLLVIIGTSNAVNLTDGIDGLAAGLSVQVALSFICIELISNPLLFDFFPSATAIMPALGGACLGFLAFNKNPARVFMGDTGSLALGAGLGAAAIITSSIFLLPFIGFIFYVEMFSVIFQVAYFKYTRRRTGEGQRLFRRAPLRHHFELSGWNEKRVVATFWAINLFTTVVGLILWKAGILPRFP